jgi:hypothetical protein
MEYERKGCGPPAREAALLRVSAARYRIICYRWARTRTRTQKY